MEPFYYQNRKKSKRSVLQKGLTGAFLVIVSAVALYCLLVPGKSGAFGLALRAMLLKTSGWASVVIPLYLGALGFSYVNKEDGQRFRSLLNAGATFLLWLSAACLFSFVSKPFVAEGAATWGGAVGDWVSAFLAQQFGRFLTFLFSVSGILAGGFFLAKISPVRLAKVLSEKVGEDLEEWRLERRKASEEKSLKKKLDQKSPRPLDSADFKKTDMNKDSIPEDRKPNIRFDEIPSKPKIIETAKASLFRKLKPAPAAVQAQTPAGQAPSPASVPSRAPAAAAGSSALAAQTDAAVVEPEAPLESYAGYVLPDPDLLSISEKALQINKEELYTNGTLLEKTLEQFGVKAKVVDIHPGPVITRYDLSPAPGVRVQQIENLGNDIALAMKAPSIRVLAPVPGKAAVGIEIPNPHPAMVYLKEIVLSPNFQNNRMIMPLGVGKTTEGEAFVSDLTSMPHLLIAGSTGSGKSVCIHGLILSILFRFRPDEVKLLLIDPKRLELPAYDAIPHLYDPASRADEVHVITDPKDVMRSLKKLVDVMEDRYRSFAKHSVRNIESYNNKAQAENRPKVSYIIVIIDELADLMIVVGREIEDLIQRLAQMARAVGIHLVLATQRPSVDVITGVIKANLPSRVAFQVLSKTDSRVILDSQGAEDLLGKGDMLFLATGAPRPVRLQGAFVSEGEVARVIQFIREQNFKPSYESAIKAGAEDSIVNNPENLEILIRAARVVRESEKVSGDLLRADREIGSKYDLALTLLKKKGLIEKPKDTNRWHIHFDRLAEFLHTVDKDLG